MKDVVVSGLLSFVTKRESYDELTLKKLKYGIEGIYVTITKFVVTFLIALITNTLLEYILFMIIYAPLRSYGYGLHASKSWMCWVTTIPIFNFIPVVSTLFVIPFIWKIIISLLFITIIIIYAPADTVKRPMKNRNKYKKGKIICAIVSIFYLVLLIIDINSMVSSLIMFSLILQGCLVSPIIYRIFKQPYNNYKYYL